MRRTWFDKAFSNKVSKERWDRKKTQAKEAIKEVSTLRFNPITLHRLGIEAGTKPNLKEINVKTASGESFPAIAVEFGNVKYCLPTPN